MKPLYEITLKLLIDIWGRDDVEVPSDQLQKALTRILSQSDDGRRPFSVEMVESGLSQLILRAATEVVSDEVRNTVGDTMVQIDLFSRISKATLIADEKTKDLRVFAGYGDGMVCSSVEAVTSDFDEWRKKY